MDRAIAKEDIKHERTKQMEICRLCHSTDIYVWGCLRTGKTGRGNPESSALRLSVGGGWISEPEQLSVQQNDDNDVDKKI